MSGENHWIQKRKMFLYSERGRNNNFQEKKLGNVLYLRCIFSVLLHRINTKKHTCIFIKILLNKLG